MEKSKIFEAALESKHVPPLTLDNKWYKLFKQAKKTSEIEELEKELSELIKEQGRINNETGKLQKLKGRLMDEIVGCMEANDKASLKKREENSRLIDEINDKLEKYKDDMLDLPREIRRVNNRLMVATMEQCYEVISDNTRDISSISEWINKMRVELKTNVVKKQEMELRNVEIYSYMHDIFGPEVIELFDITYDIEEKKQEILARRRALMEQKKAKDSKDS